MGSCDRGTTGAGSPRLIFFGVIVLERGKPQGGKSRCCPVWALGSHDNLLLPKFPGGAQPVLPRLLQPHSGPVHLANAKLLSCHSATATLSAARSLAELGTNGACGHRGASLPQTPSALLECGIL